jgi:type I restriction enzyme S subunit
MAVKKGYKQTEVGVIPEDWGVRPIREISNPVRGGSPRPAGDPRFFDGNFIPWLTVAALTNIPSSQLKVSHTDSSLTEEGSLRSRILYPGTLILANSGATLGVAKILGIKCCANDGIAALLNFNATVSTTYLVHYINTRTQYLRDVVATGNGQPNLNTDLIGNFKVPLPPTLAEQEAIAGALSDADAWIESLEQLIAKKRQIKQGAMQELLTGKRRLPGFSGKWDTKRLEEICELSIGRTPLRLRQDFWGTGFKWLSIADLQTKIVQDSKEQITTLAASTMRIIPKGTLLMSFKLSLGRLCFAGCDLFTNEAICSFENLKADADFLYYILGRTDFSLYGKQAVKGYTLNKESLKSVLVTLPPISEQTAIATVLSDMDTEIEALESKLTKAREIKQAMMQELLTGKTRLI